MDPKAQACIGMYCLRDAVLCHLESRSSDSIWGIKTALGLKGGYYQVIRQTLHKMEKDDMVIHKPYGQYWRMTREKKNRPKIHN